MVYRMSSAQNVGADHPVPVVHAERYHGNGSDTTALNNRMKLHEAHAIIEDIDIDYDAAAGWERWFADEIAGRFKKMFGWHDVEVRTFPIGPDSFGIRLFKVMPDRDVMHHVDLIAWKNGGAQTREFNEWSKRYRWSTLCRAKLESAHSDLYSSARWKYQRAPMLAVRADCIPDQIADKFPNV